jgi:hypothetical protein
VTRDLGPTRAEVLAAASGHILARALQVAVELGLADCFGDARQSAAALASATKTDARALRRLLHFLARHDYFVETEEGFGLTDKGALLRSNAPGGTAAVIRSLGHAEVWAAFGRLGETVRSGEDPRRGARLYGRTAGRDSEARVSRAMAGYHFGEPAAVAKAYDFSAFATVVDVGGSGGALLTTILAAHPHLIGTVFDRPGAEAEARNAITAANLGARCRFVGGDFFAGARPKGADLYILSHILHDWPDGKARRILEGCRRAMGSGARLIVLEALMSPGGEGESEIPADLLLLANCEGRLRSALEHEALLGSAGFRLGRIIPCGPRVSLIEAEPA